MILLHVSFGTVSSRVPRLSLRGDYSGIRVNLCSIVAATWCRCYACSLGGRRLSALLSDWCATLRRTVTLFRPTSSLKIRLFRSTVRQCWSGGRVARHWFVWIILGVLEVIMCSVFRSVSSVVRKVTCLRFWESAGMLTLCSRVTDSSVMYRLMAT